MNVPNEWPFMLTGMLAQSFASPSAASNLAMAQWGDMQRKFWGHSAGWSGGGSGEWSILQARSAGGERRCAKLLRPANAGPQAPLVVMLHGCMQDAESFDRLTGMSKLARERGFCMLIPDQESDANAMQCWNWHLPESQRRVGGEPELMALLIQKAQAQCGIAPESTHVAGISAGGALTSLMAHLYPELLGSAVIVAGPAPFLAKDLPQALSAMAHGPKASGAQTPWHAPGATRFEAEPSRPRKTLPMLIVHGEADHTVNPKNALEQAKAVVGLNDLLDDGVANGSVSQGASALARQDQGSVRVWKNSFGEPVAVLVSPKDLGHAWSGGNQREPFAQRGFDLSALALDFFASAQNHGWKGFEPEALAERLWGQRDALATGAPSGALAIKAPRASAGGQVRARGPK